MICQNKDCGKEFTKCIDPECRYCSYECLTKVLETGEQVHTKGIDFEEAKRIKIEYIENLLKDKDLTLEERNLLTFELEEVRNKKIPQEYTIKEIKLDNSFASAWAKTGVTGVDNPAKEVKYFESSKDWVPTPGSILKPNHEESILGLKAEDMILTLKGSDSKYHAKLQTFNTFKSLEEFEREREEFTLDRQKKELALKIINSVKLIANTFLQEKVNSKTSMFRIIKLLNSNYPNWREEE